MTDTIRPDWSARIPTEPEARAYVESRNGTWVGLFGHPATPEEESVIASFKRPRCTMVQVHVWHRKAQMIYALPHRQYGDNERPGRIEGGYMRISYEKKDIEASEWLGKNHYLRRGLLEPEVNGDYSEVAVSEEVIGETATATASPDYQNDSDLV